MTPTSHSPSPVKLLMFAAAWGALMAASAAITLIFVRGGAADIKSTPLIAIFALGGFMGFVAARNLLKFVPLKWIQSRRFAAAFILFALATIGFTALLFALHFRSYFAQWHDDAFSRRLVFETIFTILSAVYQFLVLGLRLYIPLGFIVLIGLSTAFARHRI